MTKGEVRVLLPAVLSTERKSVSRAKLPGPLEAVP
jgi:hypothetical protein